VGGTWELEPKTPQTYFRVEFAAQWFDDHPDDKGRNEQALRRLERLLSVELPDAERDRAEALLAQVQNDRDAPPSGEDRPVVTRRTYTRHTQVFGRDARPSHPIAADASSP